MRIAVGSADGRAAARRLPATAVLNKARKTKIRFIALSLALGGRTWKPRAKHPKRWPILIEEHTGAL
jgi:hypothetical protein